MIKKLILITSIFLSSYSYSMAQTAPIDISKGITVKQLNDAFSSKIDTNRIGADNGVAPLDATGMMSSNVSGNVGSAIYDSTRSLSQKFSQFSPNIRDYCGNINIGNQSGDEDCLQTAYNSVSDSQILEFPGGIDWPSSGSWIPDVTKTKVKYIQVDGMLLNPPGTSDTVTGHSLTNLGNDILSFMTGTNSSGGNGILSYNRVSTTDHSYTPMITYDQMNTGPSENPQGSEVVRIFADSSRTSTGNMNGLRTYLRSAGLNYSGSFDVNHWSNTQVYGTNWTWDNLQEFGIVTPFVCPESSSGDANLCTEYDENEIDFNGGGPEKKSTAWDPSSGTRWIFGAGIGYSGMNTGDSHVTWAANTSYHAYQIIVVKDSSGKPYMFQALSKEWVIGGVHDKTMNPISGTGEPSWTFNNGDIIVDGDINWTCLGSFHFDLGAVFKFSGGNDPTNGWVTRFGTLLTTDTIYCYNALIDFSTAKWDPNNKYNVDMRVQPDTYFDFTDKATEDTQNLHLLGYVSADNSLEYKVSGKSIFSLNDDGNVSIESLDTSQESHFSMGDFTDPDTGVSRDAKFGNKGIAVSGGIKTDKINITGGLSSDGGAIVSNGAGTLNVVNLNNSGQINSSGLIYSSYGMGSAIGQFTNQLIIPNMTYSKLPSTPTTGMIVLVTDGRKPGEAAGAGTGVLCVYDGTNWMNISTGTTITI